MHSQKIKAINFILCKRDLWQGRIPETQEETSL